MPSITRFAPFARRRSVSAAAAILLLTWLAPALGATPRNYVVDPKKSVATIEVDKSGLFSFAAGHKHEVEAPVASGYVRVDLANPSQADLRLVFKAAALRVTGKGDPPEDVPKVQHNMESEKVLDIAHYDEIVFARTSVDVKKTTPGELDLVVNGQLTIRGQSKGISVPVTVSIDGESLTATGSCIIKQTDFGIKPISVAGLVNVKNELAISFTIIANAETN
jgi:polyisoprenoid-binding protein YceI